MICILAVWLPIASDSQGYCGNDDDGDGCDDTMMTTTTVIAKNNCADNSDNDGGDDALLFTISLFRGITLALFLSRSI